MDWTLELRECGSPTKYWKIQHKCEGSVIREIVTNRPEEIDSLARQLIARGFPRNAAALDAEEK